MKVCIFTETFHPVIGGGETQARLLAEGLSARGFEVLVLTRRSEASLAAVDRIGPVTVYRIGRIGRGQMKKWGVVLSGLPALVRLRRQYDLVSSRASASLAFPPYSRRGCSASAWCSSPTARVRCRASSHALNLS